MTENTTDPMAAVRQTLARVSERVIAATYLGGEEQEVATDVLVLLHVLDGVVELAEEWDGTALAADLRAVLAGIGGAR